MAEHGVQTGRELPIGTTVGGCEIVGFIGKGGMGIVYRAKQLKLNRTVALKVPLPGLGQVDPRSTERFLQEARLAAQLNHANIVQVHDAGEYGDTIYIVMEFVDGESLRHRIDRKKKLGPEEALAIIHQAAKGLQAAHRRGLIHRDIKPSNFLITQDGTVKLADFGLARAVSGVSQPQLTASVVGTPHYMAPEQGGSGKADARSDIYALGVTLFEMLTGKRPYEAPTAMGILLKHLRDPIPTDLRSDPAIPRSMAALVEKAMAKRPEDRFQSAQEFLRAVQAIIAEVRARRPPGAVPDADVVSVTERVRREGEEALQAAKRQRVIWGTVAGSAALLAIAVLALTGVGREPSAPLARGPEAKPSTDVEPPPEPDPPPPRPRTSVPPPPPKRKEEDGSIPAWAKVAPEQAEGARRDGVAPAIELDLGDGVGLKMVYIPPGEFVMGAGPQDSSRPSDELPAHRVRISRGFYLGIHEVTIAQWNLFATRESRFRGAEKQPVRKVTRDECLAMIGALNQRFAGRYEFRLPTEAEWEYACRAGTATQYFWGREMKGSALWANIADEAARREFPNFDVAEGEDDGYVLPAPVASFRPNPWGLYDMIGNVGEWCEDFYDDDYYGSSPLVDPTGPAVGKARAVRGGSWFSSPENCRCASRLGAEPDVESELIGLRLACTPARRGGARP